MADPVTLALVATAASTVLSAGGAYAQGVQAKKTADYEAAQMDVNAGQDRAMAQRQAIENRREARLADSRLQAVAAASGGGASDPTVIKLSQDINAEGEYNALSSLYSGEESARQLEGSADLRRYEGKNAKRAGTIKAISTVLAGAGGMASKYGGSGPDYYNSSTGSAGTSSSQFRNGTSVYWR